MDNKPVIQSACERNCPDRWCCSTKYFSPPPVCPEEIARIEEAGHTGFYDREGDETFLKTGPDGYCIFFDRQTLKCSIYSFRPFDCRVFPFDFIPGKTEGVWVMCDCAYAREIDPAEIEAFLTRMETEYAAEILKTWDYDSEIAQRKGFCILRKMNIAPPCNAASSGME